MQLKISGTLQNPIVTDNETGAELQGVLEVKMKSRNKKYSFSTGTVELELDNAIIDLSVDSNIVETIMSQDGKYAHSKLKDVRGLRWLRG